MTPKIRALPQHPNTYRRKLTTPVLPAYNAVTGPYDIAWGKQ